MPLHDYRCPVDGTILRDQWRTAAEGAESRLPICQACLCAGSHQLMRPIPNIGAMDAKEPFQRFEAYDGQNRRVVIDSLKKLRQVEKQSETDYKNGIGQPIVFRAYSNDRSNRDQSALHKSWDGGEQPTEEAKHRFGSTLKKSVEAPDDSFGPGVNESNASALGDG